MSFIYFEFEYYLRLLLLTGGRERHQRLLVAKWKAADTLLLNRLISLHVISERFDQVLILVLLGSHLEYVIQIFDGFMGFRFSHVLWIHQHFGVVHATPT